MVLTLEVVSSNGASLGANRRRAVGAEGVQIGRAKENDWVIPDPYISRVNARVRYVNGAFYIEGLGRNPLAVNDVANVVANNEPQLLRNGDRFFLDQYEFRVTIGSNQTEPLIEDPFAPLAASADAALADLVPDGADASDAALDPLAVLGNLSTAPHTPPRPVDFDQSSPLDDHFTPPRIVTPPAGIPEKWDSKLTDAAPARPQPGRPDARAASKASIPDAWDKTHFEAPKAPPAPPAAPRRMPPRQQTVRRPDPPIAAAPAAPVAMPPPLTQAEPSASARLSLEQLLRAAGVPATQMTPEVAAEMGEVLRIVVQGLMDVLHSRAEIKSQLRMAMTRVKPTENNPLKFSPNVEAALHTLFVERNAGYLPTVRAFEEALLDIRNHQIAVLEGIRSAFDSMLENFNPERIDAELERQSKRGGLLGVGAKGRFRDYYVDEFERLSRDRDEAFKRLFGEAFAEAYEQQLDRLKAAARAQGTKMKNDSGRAS